MTLFTARIKAEAAYKQAVEAYRADPSAKNEQRVKVKLALLEGLKRWLCERSWG